MFAESCCLERIGNHGLIGLDAAWSCWYRGSRVSLYVTSFASSWHFARRRGVSSYRAGG